jgi:hypothetical protein
MLDAVFPARLRFTSVARFFGALNVKMSLTTVLSAQLFSFHWLVWWKFVLILAKGLNED